MSIETENLCYLWYMLEYGKLDIQLQRSTKE